MDPHTGGDGGRQSSEDADENIRSTKGMAAILCQVDYTSKRRHFPHPTVGYFVRGHPPPKICCATLAFLG